MLHDCVSLNKRVVVAFNASARMTSPILSRSQIPCLHECVLPTAKMMLLVFPSPFHVSPFVCSVDELCGLRNCASLTRWKELLKFPLLSHIPLASKS